MTVTSKSEVAAAAIHEDTVVPACEPWSARIAEGDHLRLVDLEGQQAIDFLCFNAEDPTERYSAANTLKLAHNIYLNQDSVLRSSRARPMMTLVADTCGQHDTIYGCCSIELDKLRYGKTNSRGCLSNFESELAKHGLGPRDVVPNVNFFMYAPVAADGAVTVVEGRSKPGDYVELRAEMDVLVVISNCPERDNPAAGFEPTPVRAVIYTPA